MTYLILEGSMLQGHLCGTNLLSKIIWFHGTDTKLVPYFTGPSLKHNGIKAHIRFIGKF